MDLVFGLMTLLNPKPVMLINFNESRLLGANDEAYSRLTPTELTLQATVPSADYRGKPHLLRIKLIAVYKDQHVIV